MKKYLKVLLLLVLLVIPFNVNAINKEYTDRVYKIVNVEKEEGKVNLYLFHRTTCPHCKKEIEFLNSIKNKYKNLNIYMFAVDTSKDNINYYNEARKKFNITGNYVPFTIIGDEKFIGFSDLHGDKIEKAIQLYTGEKGITENDKNTYKIPLLGKINVKDGSLLLIAVVLGLVDGFNPCAMWILLFLINMLFNMKNKRKMLIIGYTFLFTSALVYFVSMLGMSLILGIAEVNWIQKIIALVALVIGVLNIRKYIKQRKEAEGCAVVDEKKRKKMFEKIKKITTEKSMFLALSGVIVLAISVNLIELACSLGFPTIFSEILAINNVTGLLRIIYLLVYVLMYMIDDIIVFTIAVSTLSLTAKSNKYSKYVSLIAGILMILMGILLIFKPEWIMLNF